MWRNIAARRLYSPFILASLTPLCSNFLSNKAEAKSEDLPEKEWDANWDKREVEYLSSAVKKRTRHVGATRHILLVRHGQYEMNKDDRNQNLTTLGRLQSKLVGERLRALDVPIHCVWTSTMNRSIETSNIIMESIGKVVENYKQSDLLCEGCPRIPEPKLERYAPNSATVFQDSARIEAGFRLIFHRVIYKNEDLDESDHEEYNDEEKTDPEHYDVVVCHGNVIRYCLLRVLQLDTSAWLRFALNNGSITWVTIFADGKVSVRSVGDSGHIPKEHSTYS